MSSSIDPWADGPRCEVNERKWWPGSSTARQTRSWWPRIATPDVSAGHSMQRDRKGDSHQIGDILVKSRECHDRGDIPRGGMVFHLLNRGVGRRLLFTKDEDFLAFERV